ncbi:hypothetical protein [Pseudoxanthomonas sp.]|nr:hypothetical protein [Pseudoxanthomonas sp.]
MIRSVLKARRLESATGDPVLREQEVVGMAMPGVRCGCGVA